MKIIDAEKMAELTLLAQASPRKRSHFNLHESLEEGIHRLCIAAEPDTVIHPHRHRDKWELLFVLKGVIDTYIYDRFGMRGTPACGKADPSAVFLQFQYPDSGGI